MIRYLRSVVDNHPKKLLILILLLLTGAGAGFRAYALHQWHEAQEAIRDERPNDARKPLEFCLFLWPRDVRVHILAARAARLRADFETAEAELNYCLKREGEATDDIKLEFLLLRVQRGEVDDVAQDLFGYVERKHPESLLILQTVARAYMFNLRYRPAYGVLSRWIKEFPDSAQAYQWRGWVLERMNNTPKFALKDYQRALELNPDLLDARLRMVEIYLEQSDTEATWPHLEYLIQQAPERAEVQARWGQYLYLKGKGDEARQLCEAAVQNLPNDSMLLITLAKLDLDRAKRETSPSLKVAQAVQAEKWLRHVLEIDPSDQAARINLVTCLQLQGRREEAAQELAHYEQQHALLVRSDELLKQETDHPTRDPRPAFEIGDALLRMQQERLGLYWLHEALNRDPTHLPSHRALAEYYEKKGDKAQAAMHRRAVNAQPTRPTDTPGNTDATPPKPKQ